MSSNLLQKIYYDPSHPASFSTCERLYKAVDRKIPKKDIKKWLKNQLAHTLHARSRKNFHRCKYIVDNISDQWQTDLMDLRNLAPENDGINYVVVVIDIFSKYVWTVPIERKTPEEIINAFDIIFSKTREKPAYLASDRGREYVNQKFSTYLKNKGIKYFSANSDDKKCCIVERVIRTLKELIFKYLTSQNTLRYVNVLEKITHAYNNRHHSAIGMCPAQVNPKNILQVWKNLYKNGKQAKELKPSKFKEGEFVRVSKLSHVFSKGYLPNYSDEIFKIKRVLQQNSLNVYKLEDLMHEEILGIFYEEELQSVINDDNTVHRVEKILKSRKIKGRNEVLVQWMGCPKKFNSWIPFTNIYN